MGGNSEFSDKASLVITVEQASRAEFNEVRKVRDEVHKVLVEINQRIKQEIVILGRSYLNVVLHKDWSERSYAYQLLKSEIEKGGWKTEYKREGSVNSHNMRILAPDDFSIHICSHGNSGEY